MRAINIVVTVLAVFMAGCVTDNAYLAGSSGGKASRPSLDIYFSPTGGCQKAILDIIGGARTEIRMQAYVLTDTNIVDALCRAQARGVDVQVALDGKFSKTSQGMMIVKALVASKVRTWADSKHAIAHNKVVVVDKTTVVTGSYNFSYSAEARNAENMLVMVNARETDGRMVADRYVENWKTHTEHSEEAR